MRHDNKGNQEHFQNIFFSFHFNLFHFFFWFNVEYWSFGCWICTYWIHSFLYCSILHFWIYIWHWESKQITKLNHTHSLVRLIPLTIASARAGGRSEAMIPLKVSDSSVRARNFVPESLINSRVFQKSINVTTNNKFQWWNYVDEEMKTRVVTYVGTNKKNSQSTNRSMNSKNVWKWQFIDLVTSVFRVLFTYSWPSSCQINQFILNLNLSHQHNGRIGNKMTNVNLTSNIWYYVTEIIPQWQWSGNFYALAILHKCQPANTR